MNMKNKDFLQTGLIVAGLAVALGAFGAHGLKQYVSPPQIDTFKTGVQYQMYHAFAIIIAVCISQYFDNQWIRRACWFFLIGILLFSGSLYLFTFFEATSMNSVRWLGPVTPLGGVCFLIGWVLTILGVRK
jgi:uncharacterized membrane protein YgdD (TMEM256/DUF423 family)